MTRWRHGPLPPPAPSRRPWPWLGAAIALAALWTLGGCEPCSPDYRHAAGGPPRTAEAVHATARAPGSMCT